jgi:hypothetical protein
MTWDDFYDKYCDWSESTVKTRISSLENIGNGEDVIDVVLNLSYEKVTDIIMAASLEAIKAAEELIDHDKIYHLRKG